MKVGRSFVLLCILLATVALSAVARTVPYGNSEATVENNVITYKGISYTYTESATSRGYETKITYPDGLVFLWEVTQNSGSITGGGGGYQDLETTDEMVTAKGYLTGFELIDLLEAAVPRPNEKRGNVLLGIVLIAAGLLNLVFPKKVYALTVGWQYKNLEPSDARLTLNAICGLVVAVFGFFMLLA